MEEKECPYCGTHIPIDATKCFSCKNWVDETEEDIIEKDEEEETDRPVEFLPTLLFAYFLGMFGVHRFYTGHIAIGVIQLLTLGACGLWTYIDYILICFNKFKDAKNRELRNYDKNIGIVLFVVSLIPILLLVLILFIILGIFMLSTKQ